jgi:hypothetical protein
MSGMPKSGATIHFCKGCEARGVQTRVPAGQQFCPQCQRELRDRPEAVGVTSEQLIKVKAREEQRSEAVWCAIKYGVGSVLVTELFLLEIGTPGRHSHTPLVEVPTVYYLVLGVAAYVVGTVVGWFIGTKRPPWKDMM